MIELVADNDYERLDLFLAEKLDISRTKAAHYIGGYNVIGPGRLKSSMKVKMGQRFFVEPPVSMNTVLEADSTINFDVLYEDEYIIVLNKPAGIIVHPAPGMWNHTLVNGLIYRYPEFRNMPEWNRPGIVHRLDMGTSGLMMAARQPKVCDILQMMFRNRRVNKRYLALAHGTPERNEGTLSGPIAHDPDNYLRMIISDSGKPALTGYKVLWSMGGISLVECRLFTGRTHQIRVHMSALGHPLVGDGMYGACDIDVEPYRVYLHSWRLDFEHPITREQMNFRLTIPDDFKDYIKRLKEK